MLRLDNPLLSVDLLDPVADRRRQGPRFCWGGYVWQVHHRTAGPLLAGPEWPQPEPVPFNGQGVPESFRHRTTEGEPLLWQGPVGLAPGAGELALEGDQVVVKRPCEWEVELKPSVATFRTRQAVAGWAYELARSIALEGNRLTSTSRLVNAGTAPLRLQWFAHPFFALHRGMARITVPAGTQLRENPGFGLRGRTIEFRRVFQGAADGHLDHLELPPATELEAEISHPAVGSIRFHAGFNAFKCVLWANGNTVSLEPYLALDLAPGAAREWTLTYDFGPAA